MVYRLLSGILAVTFVPLGAMFVIVGLAVQHPDRGEPKDFVYVGVPFLVVGAGLAAAFVVLWRREAGRRRRRRQGLRVAAEVVRADVNWNVRVNGRPMLRLTVRIQGHAVSGAFVVGDGPPPAPGAWIEVLYDPTDPANFEPVKLAALAR